MKYLVFTLILITTSCSHKKHHHHGHANQVMNKKVFEKLVEAFESPERESYQKPNLVIASMGNIKGKKIIDIGAGTGYFSMRMAQKGALVTHADVDERFLNYAMQRSKKLKLLNNLFIKKVPYDSPLMGQAQYDYALIVNTYHHIEDRIEYFRKVKDGLRGSGKLIIVDFKKPAVNGEPEDFPSVEMRISAQRIQEELAQAGYTQFKVDNKMLPYQFVISAY